MSIVRSVRRRLGRKLFLSYLIVIVVGVVVLASTAELTIPTTFGRHMAGMRSMMGGAGTEMGREADLFASFRTAVSESLVLAASAATLAAVVVSLLVSRRVVAPVRDMIAASQRIAEGHYDERVQLRGSPVPEEIDELDQLAVTFNQMAARLERTEDIRRQLIGDVAHELRTPLSTIKGRLEGLMDGVLPPDEANLLQIYREADRLQRLVADLQELSRVEAGAFELNPRPVQVRDLVAGAADRLGRQFEEKEVMLNIELPAGLPLVVADEDRIGQVLLNLLGNALQYTPAGRSVRVRSRQVKQEIEIEIRDEGIGIPAEHLAQVFTRFYRVDRSRSRVGGGSGIGLTIAKHLVEAHGGRIWADSPGHSKGSAFTFTLPIEA
ncbi:MAG: ATP-binding protein [Chloroflexota bacterium]